MTKEDEIRLKDLEAKDIKDLTTEEIIESINLKARQVFDHRKDVKDLTPEEIIDYFHLEPYQMSIDLNTHEVTYYY